MKSTNEEIINTTIAWINKNGYQDFSLRKLAKEINMSAPAIYKHFKNKDDLFEKVTEELSASFMKNVNLDATQSIEEKILIIAQQFCQQFELQTNLMDFLFFNSQSVANFDFENIEKYPFLQNMKYLIHEANPGKITDQQLFIKLWSFIQGYALLLKNNIVKYDPELVSISLKQLLGEE